MIHVPVERVPLANDVHQGLVLDLMKVVEAPPRVILHDRFRIAERRSKDRIIDGDWRCETEEGNLGDDHGAAEVAVVPSYAFSDGVNISNPWNPGSVIWATSAPDDLGRY